MCKIPAERRGDFLRSRRINRQRHREKFLEFTFIGHRRACLSRPRRGKYPLLKRERETEKRGDKP